MFTFLKKKTSRSHTESLMAVDERGHLVLDRRALSESGVLDRQYQAADRLYEVLKARKKK